MNNSSDRIDVLAVMDAHLPENFDGAMQGPSDADANRLRDARAAVAELIEADREVDAIEAEMRAAYFAGPRYNSYGIGWEDRDAAAQKDRERRHEAAHNRRNAALARVTP